ncbi:MAG: ABC transporter permease [Gammaproteobacteria bacterium]|nr:ABC transporter permease [Gammaproteobacteria bacterium]
MGDSQPASNASDSHSQAELIFDQQTGVLRCQGAWTLAHIDALFAKFKTLRHPAKIIKQIDLSQLTQLDSAGALVIKDISCECNQLPWQGLAEKFNSLMQLVSTAAEQAKKIEPPEAMPNWFYRVGMFTYDKFQQIIDFLAFIGELMIIILNLMAKPWRLQWSGILNAVDDAGYQALPILALLSFLIGVVLAYQLGIQLQSYGANIFIVDVTGTATLREFGPLITAIILSGRTSTAFASLIGTMKVNEEIDALKTMGVGPIERLVAPRIFGLLIAFPLLIIWADIFTMLGSMLMAKTMLGISYHAFLHRMRLDVSIDNYILGLEKAPIFALIITGVGCFQGFQVLGSADSVGKQTTKAAVQAIFLIIAADAFYSVAFNWLGL